MIRAGINKIENKKQRKFKRQNRSFEKNSKIYKNPSWTKQERKRENKL